VKKTCIPLGILFNYPTNTDLPQAASDLEGMYRGMSSFWRGDIENLEKEMEAYEILNSSGDSSDGIQPEIRTTPADFM
jgi:hypothetical protein